MSQFFKSDQVQLDLNSIFETYQEVANKTSMLGTMTKEEKLNHIQDCKNLIDKQKTFYTRLTLASQGDIEASDMKTRINALANAFGYRDIGECMDTMVQTLEQAAQEQVDDD
ncbi:hypothetical protein Syn7803C97_215 [Synechococcus phage S-MbCM6]|jgi:hypothetical protein|uniref:DUF1825 n=3 Tax=Namakavirus smbcm6 TaxID=2734120 RepID=H8ZMY0_9CAUD|nr:DUF1825 [Synechococcus phage ACG-2014c]AHB80850.1 hypothetical protein S-MbCM25_215 [Synechococcus phage S-MbCM25]AFD02841.1 DUF1825 [Synechococcus phage ACG-2014c]AIX14611.1 hypothetical protein Syn7803C43_216 [Synechococcus phage ACG-2014c]AIX22768.1 hypothetical protein Syn7803C97_215 [Synechococcus phage ACG-2014c]AIX22983.1 hypothetical protein Syn7803C98_215 [Synechococcus phage ACG-2014c]